MADNKNKASDLLKMVAREGDKLNVRERRNFLKQGLFLAGGAIAGSTLSNKAGADEANLPPNVPRWSKSLGAGVVTNPYGKPSKLETKAKERL